MVALGKVVFAGSQTSSVRLPGHTTQIRRTPAARWTPHFAATVGCVSLGEAIPITRSGARA
jgi:hypothetical protein